MRVAAGAIARKYLATRHGIEIRGWLAQLGPIALDVVDLDSVDDNPFFCPDPARVPELEAYMDRLRKEGDSIGARINVIATGVPPGLGEPVFDKLDADIAHAMMGINAVKAVEIGDGFAVVEQKGTEHRDEMTPEGFLSNHAGGTLGGISSGQAIRVSMALKPTSSLRCRGARSTCAASPRRSSRRAPRSLRRHPRHADRRGDAGAGADGSPAQGPRPERGRRAGSAADP
jgi:chorismate synthase